MQAALFKHFGDGHEDDGTYNPDVQKYNTLQYRNWKKECIHICKTPDVASVTSHIAIRAINIVLTGRA